MHAKVWGNDLAHKDEHVPFLRGSGGHMVDDCVHLSPAKDVGMDRLTRNSTIGRPKLAPYDKDQGKTKAETF